MLYCDHATPPIWQPTYLLTMVRPKQTVSRYPYAKPGRNRAYREIPVMQKYAGFLVPRAVMSRFIREIAQIIKPNLRFRVNPLLAIQEATETFIIQLFQDANLFALHRKRVTVELRDLQLLCNLMYRHNVFAMRR